MFKLVYWAAYLLLYPIYRFRFVGRENLPPGGCIVCANHTAIIDGLLVVLALGPAGHYAVMGKAELFKNRLFAAILRFVRVFPVRRGESDVGAVRAGLQALKDGKRLIIFPEGTRARDGEALEAKAGAGLFAVRGGVPAVPVYIPVGKKAWRRNRILFGPAITAPKIEGRRPAAADYADFSVAVLAQVHAMGAGAGGVSP